METPACCPRLIVRVMKWMACVCPVLLGATYSGISLFSAEVLTRTHNHRSVVDPQADQPRRHPLVGPDAGWLDAARMVSADQRPATPRRAGPWSLELLARDGGARARPPRARVRRASVRPPRPRPERPVAVFMGRRERGDLRAVLAWAKRPGVHARPDRLGRLLDGGVDALDGGGAEPEHPGGRDRQPLRQPARAARRPAQPSTAICRAGSTPASSPRRTSPTASGPTT